jgi:hypothetical protein
MRVVTGLVAEWSCSGLQIRVRRFDSDPGLHAYQRLPRRATHYLNFAVGAPPG